MSKARLVRLLAMLLLGTLPVLPLAATITVDDCSDYDFGNSPSNGDGKGCTLRKALANANNNAQTFSACAAGSGSDNIIAFSCGTPTITLGTLGSPLFVNRNLTLQGPATIDGSQENDIFRVSAGGVSFAIDQLTLKNGANSAVKIFSSTSSFKASNCLFEDNTVPGSGGGAISSSGPIDINLCAFIGNSSTGSSDGGGAIRLSSSDPSTISNSAFINNTSKTMGGAIQFSNSGNIAALLVDNVVFLANTAKAEGGSSEGGGAIWHQNGLLTVINSVFAGNKVEGDEGRGGALYLALGSPVAVLERNLFTLNEAEGDEGLGGAIFSARAALVSNSSFITNEAARGGAIASTVKLKGGISTTAPGFLVSNSTLHDNRAKKGGGIYSFGPEQGSVERGITLINVTLDGNEAEDAGGGGGLYLAEVQTGRKPEADVRNSILSNNTANGANDNCNSNASIAIQNGGGNLLSHSGTCSATPAIAEIGDPKLATPAPDPTPPTFSMELKKGSRAVQIGLNAVCSDFPILNLDQRFASRPAPEGTACDAGAYEAEIGPPAPEIDVTPDAGLAFGQVPLGNAANLEAMVGNTGTLPLESLALNVSGTGFSLAGTSCGSSLAAGASCNVAIAFQPGSGGPLAGQLQATGAGGLSDSITLTGTGFVATPGLDLTPNAGLAFGNQQVGSTSAFLEATLNNTGNVPLSGIAFSVAAPFQLESGGTCATSLAAQTSCTQRLSFSPVAPGTVSANLSVSSADGPNDSIVVSGRGTTPAALSLAPIGGIDFGQIPAGSQSDPFQAVLTNTGTEPAQNVGFTFVGFNGNFQFVSDDCPTDLLGGQSCSAELRYAPPTNSSGAEAAQFRGQAIFLFSNQITLSASAFVPAVLALAPDELIDFGDVLTGDVSPQRIVSIRNLAGEPLVIEEVGTAAPFVIVSPTCVGAVISAGNACAVVMEARPSLDGEARATLSVQARSQSLPASNPANRQYASVPLRVLGYTPADIVIAPTEGIDFGAVAVGDSSPVRTIAVFNPGSRSLGSFGLLVSAGATIDLVASSCGSNLAGGASCSVQLAYQPGSAATMNAQFMVSGTPQGGGLPITRQVPLAGSGFTPTPQLRFDPAEGLDFGSVARAASSPAQSLLLRNIGAATAGYTLSVTSGPFSISGGSCNAQAGGGNLAAGASCSVELVFTPQVNGSLQATLGALSAGIEQQATLRGTAFELTAPRLQLDPAAPGPLRFAVRVGQSEVRSLVVSNIGSGNLSVGQPNLAGTGASDFLLLTPMPIDLAASASQSLQVACQPTRVGSRQALLTLSSTDPAAASVGIALDCEGIGTLFGDGFEPDPASLIP
jgi:hypothetical protein